MRQVAAHRTIDAHATDAYTSDAMAQAKITYPQLMSATDAARVLGVNRSTLHRWIRAGALNAMTIGRMNLLARDDVLELAKQRRREALAEAVDGSPPGPSELRIVYEATGDPMAFSIKVIAPDGSELHGVCSFDEDINAWTERVMGNNEQNE